MEILSLNLALWCSIVINLATVLKMIGISPQRIRNGYFAYILQQFLSAYLGFCLPSSFFLISKIQREGDTQNIKLWISGEGDSVKLSKELQAICINSFAGPCPAAAWWVDTCTGHEQGTPSFDHGHSFSWEWVIYRIADRGLLLQFSGA